MNLKAKFSLIMVFLLAIDINCKVKASKAKKGKERKLDDNFLHANQNMQALMGLMDRQTRIRQIGDLVDSFEKRLDELNESINEEITSLSNLVSLGNESG